MNIESITARKLLQLKAFTIQTEHPIRWANGWKAPVYLDDRKILSYTQARAFFKVELSRLVAENFPDIDMVAGIASTAIAHGVIVAEQLGLPFVYVHPTPKDHGLENQIEGDLRPRQKVIIVENQVNTGVNLIKVIEAIRNNGCTVVGVVTIFNFEFPSAQKKLNVAGVPIFALSNFHAFMEQLKEDRLGTPEVIGTLEAWYTNPKKWKP